MSEPEAVVESIYWQRTRRFSAGLLLVWFGVTFVAAFFAREIDFSFFGWPFSFWFGAQGALLLYLLLVAAYAWWMERLERRQPPDPAEG
jgi:putative solute:sodium symporter small subunit